MFRPRSTIVSTLLVVLLLVLAAGPQVGGAQEEAIELRVWDQFTGPKAEAVDAIYEGFTEQHPNVTIAREAVSTDQLRQAVNTALASGTGPDLIQSDAGPAFAGLLADAGLILPLDEFATQYGWRDRIVPLAVEASLYNGQLYALPLTIDIFGLYYNKTLLDEAGLTVPETVEQLIAFCGQAQEAGYIPIAFGNNPGWQGGHQFSMTSNDMIGAEAMRALLFENQGSWNTPEMVTAIKSFFVDLEAAGCFNEDPNATTYDDGAEHFYSGQALLTPTGSWFVRSIEANMPDSEVAFVPFPMPTGAAERIWTAGVGSAYSVSSATEHPEEVGMFLDYLISPATASRWVGEASFFLPLQVDTAALTMTPLFNSVLTVLQSAANGETALGYNIDVLAPASFNEAMANGFQAVLAGDKTPEEQAADLQAAWDEGFRASGTPQP
jgi:raffinose/stachyose/melibiose transport system substrate-binding protein